ncbi:hypothetical protein HMPREF3291_08170 [Bacillus sp. HMSC76G11]|nr:hypothetical protein HMPREF3291_08170 [Bacillus sp. HMSC76G11]
MLLFLLALFVNIVAIRLNDKKLEWSGKERTTFNMKNNNLCENSLFIRRSLHWFNFKIHIFSIYNLSYNNIENL